MFAETVRSWSAAPFLMIRHIGSAVDAHPTFGFRCRTLLFVMQIIAMFARPLDWRTWRNFEIRRCQGQASSHRCKRPTFVWRRRDRSLSPCIGRSVSVCVVDGLAEGDRKITTEVANSLALFFRLGAALTILHLAHSPIDACPRHAQIVRYASDLLLGPTA